MGESWLFIKISVRCNNRFFSSVNYEDTSCESNSLEAVEEVHIEVMVAQTVTAGRIETAEIALQLVVRSSASLSRDCLRRVRGRT